MTWTYVDGIARWAGNKPPKAPSSELEHVNMGDWYRQERDVAIRVLHRSGLKGPEIAQRLHVTNDVVHNAITARGSR